MDKQGLRKKLIAKRRALPDYRSADAAIARKVLSSAFFQQAEKVLCYVSLPDEVATEPMMKAAWEQGKRVAVPYSDGDCMEFFLINSLDGLHTGAFGVREPDPHSGERLTDFSHSICLVPGLAFTPDGYRIGYGKGYYDKFLKNYPFLSVGLCYNSLILEDLPTEDYDIPVDIVITDQTVFGGKYGRI